MPETKLPLPLLPASVRWAAVTVVAGIIFHGSLFTVPESRVVESTQPASVSPSAWRHLVAYAVLAGSLAYAVEDWEMNQWKRAALVIVVAAAYGIAMEIGQHFLPHRTPFQVMDATLNVLGASAVFGWYLARPYVELIPIHDLYRDHVSRD